MEKRIYDPDKSKLDETAARIITDTINGMLKKKLFVVLAVAGGRSVGGVFNSLIKQDIPWEAVHIFIVDEKLVPLEHEESNFRLAKESFLGKLIEERRLPKGNVHPFIHDPTSPDLGLANYRKQLEQWGGSFDIVLLSSGEDGHIGALYPNHHSIRDTSPYFIAMDDGVKAPNERMSSSRKLLLRSKVALILFYDDIKKDALKMFLDSKTSFEACPAKLAKGIEESYVLTNIQL